MPDQPTFGRRRPTTPTGGSPSPSRPLPSGPTVKPSQLSPAVEAFRADLKTTPSNSEFGRWSGARQRRLLAIWAVRISLMTPGLLGFTLHLPLSMSIGLEVAGLATAGWLRRERRRHRAAIVAWEEADDDR